jgi:1-deoxy-D-xylulose-5-phosphate reductoisomerase
VPFAALADPAAATRLDGELRARKAPTQVIGGVDGMVEIAALPEVDSVMAAIVGAAGLRSTLAAARAGKRLLLANKESLVMAGPLLMQIVRNAGATLLPIDSEHNAVFQCLPPNSRCGEAPPGVKKILLTASGGPFLDADRARLDRVTPDEACAHPNWVMGRKISVDSATMMNKALEVIEARWLFDLAPQQIRVVLHPQSVIHSMVVLRDNSVLAQLGTPDMRVPIAYSLSFPERIESGASQLDFLQMSALSFEEADFVRYPGLKLAWDTLRGPEGSTAILNAANEIGVASFLAGTIRFDQIHSVNVSTLDAMTPERDACRSLDGLIALDEQARRVARARVAEMSA